MAVVNGHQPRVRNKLRQDAPVDDGHDRIVHPHDDERRLRRFQRLLEAGNGIAAMSASGAAAAGIVVHRTSVLGNAGSGILAQGAGALVHLGNSSVVGNGAGLNPASGGQILSYQNNEASGNTIDGASTGMLTPK
jgi:hypothetical protein